MIHVIPPTMESGGQYRKATFAAGCFWGVESAFRYEKGVIGTRVGYTGGTVRMPSYEQVCSGATGHAEAVEIVFDPALLPYDRLLDIFWKIHDPTQLNRQGPDIGSNYRSAIFYHTPDQQAMAFASRERLLLSGKCGTDRIVTEIVPATEFWPAEDCHQQFYEKCGQGFCVIRQVDE